MPIPEKIYESALDELENEPFRGLLARLIAEEGSFDKGKAKYLVVRAKELWNEDLAKAKLDVPDEDSDEEPDEDSEFNSEGHRITGTIEVPFDVQKRSFGRIRLSKSEYKKQFPDLPYPFNEEDRNAPSF
jgi:hypothetical protein